jgi:1-acyl-sn-glycerol-3-phosphate acyltransferase
MKMPKITIDNHEEIYQYLGDYKQNQKFMRRVYAFYSALFRPRLIYAKGARMDLDLIRDKEYHHIYVANHRVDRDAYMSFEIMHKIMPTDAGKVRLLAHSIGFESIFARLCRNLGVIPAFLKIYYTNSTKHKDHPERLALVPEATQSMLDCLVYVMTQHRQKLFIFPEGIFNPGAPDTLLPIRKGTGIIAHRVAQTGDPVAITPIGIAYNKTKQQFASPFRASLYVERPIFIEPDMTVDEITELIRKRLLTSVQKAVELH